MVWGLGCHATVGFDRVAFAARIETHGINVAAGVDVFSGLAV